MAGRKFQPLAPTPTTTAWEELSAIQAPGTPAESAYSAAFTLPLPSGVWTKKPFTSRVAPRYSGFAQILLGQVDCRLMMLKLPAWVQPSGRGVNVGVGVLVGLGLKVGLKAMPQACR